MAEALIKSYNVFILKSLSLKQAILAAAFVCVAFAPSAAAQSTLQPTGGSLQPQTGQAQSTNNLNQTGQVQNNPGGQSFLNRSGLSPLTVVSDPNQTSPDATVAASEGLKTDLTPQKSSLLPWIVAITLLLAAVAGIWLWRADQQSPSIETAIESFEPIATPKPKKDKKARKKRRKNQRR